MRFPAPGSQDCKRGASGGAMAVGRGRVAEGDIPGDARRDSRSRRTVCRMVGTGKSGFLSRSVAMVSNTTGRAGGLRRWIPVGRRQRVQVVLIGRHREMRNCPSGRVSSRCGSIFRLSHEPNPLRRPLSDLHVRSAKHVAGARRTSSSALLANGGRRLGCQSYAVITPCAGSSHPDPFDRGLRGFHGYQPPDRSRLSPLPSHPCDPCHPR